MLIRFIALATLQVLVGVNPAQGYTQTPVSSNIHFNCDVSEVKPFLPGGQSNITVPSDVKPRFIVVGLGTQNYTCSDKGSYTSVCTVLFYVSGYTITDRAAAVLPQAGALASLYDVSCVAITPIFDFIQDKFFSLTNPASAQSVIDVLLLDAVLKLGDHFFKPSDDGKGIVPVFDFTLSLNDIKEFAASKKTGDLLSPDSLGDVDWLQLETVHGNLAKFVYRLKTRAGQPPASCTKASEAISVPYAAQYWFYK